jgi:hypothetical protein
MLEEAEDGGFGLSSILFLLGPGEREERPRLGNSG